MKYETIQFDGEMRHRYWDGRANLLVRYWTYLRGGLGLVNEAKNYLLLVFGSFWTAKVIVIAGYSINPNWTIAAGFIGVPCLIWIGRWQLYKANKTQEYMTQNVATITGYNSYNMAIDTLEVNKQQNEKLDKIIELFSKKEDNGDIWS